MCLDKTQCKNIRRCAMYDYHLVHHFRDVTTRRGICYMLNDHLLSRERVIYHHPIDERILICDNAIPNKLPNEARDYLQRIEVCKSCNIIGENNYPENRAVCDISKYREILGPANLIEFNHDLLPFDAYLVPFSKEKGMVDNYNNTLVDTLHNYLSGDGIDSYIKFWRFYKSQNLANEHPHWERYHSDFWRLSISDLDEYVLSPLSSLLDALTVAVTQIFGKNYRINYMVLQLIEKGSKMAVHDDKHDGRDGSFIYYLTPDEYCGGELRVHNNGSYIDIEPKFNQLICWYNNEDYPMHEVLEILSDNRFCIVGFLSKY